MTPGRRLPKVLAALALGAATAAAIEPAPSPTPTPSAATGFRLVPPGAGLVSPPLPEAADLKSLDTATRPPPLGKERRPELLWAPIPISNPSVGTGLALAGACLFALDREDTVSPATTAALGALYTSSGTWAAAGAFKSYLARDIWRVLGILSYGDVRTDYYGIGTDSGAAGVSVPLHQKGSYVLLEGLRRVVPALYAGLRYQRLDLKTETTGEVPPEIASTLPAAEFESTSAALGLRAQFDTRDNTHFPTTGEFFDATATFAAPDLGGDQRHQKYLLGLNLYRSFGTSAILAARLALCGVGGAAPHYALCLFGSDGDLRGYKSGQYRDRFMIAAQAEFRLVLPKKFGAVAFLGLGEVAPSFPDLNGKNILGGGGLGLRYRVTKQDPINLRVDYAWGRGGGGFYVGVGEAF